MLHKGMESSADSAVRNVCPACPASKSIFRPSIPMLPLSYRAWDAPFTIAKAQIIHA